MANYVLFISENKIKDSSALGGNIDSAFILPYLKIAQKKYIETKLGTDLFVKLQSDITAGSLSGVYQTLVDDYIQDALVHWGFFECLPFLRLRVSNNGIGVKTSETTESISLEETNSLREEVRNTAEFYTNRLVDFISHNTSDYPEYNTNSGSDVDPDRDSFYSGMNLEGVGKTRPGEITLDDFLTPDLKP